MKTKKIVIGMAASLLLLTGCGKVPVLSNGEEAVVSLDNGGISVDELYKEMKNKYALSVLLDMIDDKILAEKYPETEDEKLYIENMIAQEQIYYEYFKSQYATYQYYIQAKYGVRTDEELKEVLSLNYKRNKAVEDYAKEIVTDSEINKYYEEKTVGDISASHILITADYESGATEEEKKAAEEKALETAKEVIAKLNNGEDFATLAKEYSKDGSAENGGVLKEFNRGDMDDDFFEAALKLNINEYSKEPVKSQFGYHIILKTGQKEKPTLDSVKEEIIEILAEEKIDSDSNINYKALIDLREKNGITIEDKELKDQYETYIYNTTN